jgi:hypothetical protein
MNLAVDYVEDLAGRKGALRLIFAFSVFTPPFAQVALRS